jgi:hypothetical protein
MLRTYIRFWETTQIPNRNLECRPGKILPVDVQFVTEHTEVCCFGDITSTFGSAAEERILRVSAKLNF